MARSRAALLLLALLSSAAAKRFSKAADAVRLDGIHALTFQDGKQTTHRRVAAMPQLNCISGSGCAHYQPPTIRCTNSGSSYTAADIEWTCKADLPPEFKLGATEVVCEGYDSAADDFVLKGSCALEYRLLLTDAGHDRFGRSSSAWLPSSSDSGGSGGVVAVLFWLAFGAVVLVIAYSLVRECLRNGVRRGAGGPGFGGGGGGGGGDDDDPPPPYDPRPPKAYGRRAQDAAWGWGLGGSRRQGRAQGQGQGWRPGFWTGTAAGAAAGYFAGNRGGGGGGQQMRQRTDDPGLGSSARPFGGGGGGGGSSFSSTRYESTGFGGTRRR